MPPSSKNILRAVVLIWFAVLLAACEPSIPPRSPAVLTINFTPPLKPFGAVFQTCTHMQPGLSLLVNELSIEHIDSLPSDIILTWGESTISNREPYQTGSEELVFIVNRENPVNSITAGQLDGLLSGKTELWGGLLQPACADCPADSVENPLSESPVELWTYPSGDESLSALASFPGGTSIPLFDAGLVPDPSAMRQVVAQNRAALGFIPRRWLDESVRLLEIRDLPSGTGSRPILAYPSEPHSPSANAFINCLQQVLNP